MNKESRVALTVEGTLADELREYHERTVDAARAAGADDAYANLVADLGVADAIHMTNVSRMHREAALAEAAGDDTIARMRALGLVH
jgi:hypothetical protein